MQFPFYVCELTKEQKEIFSNHFVENDNRFYFEGIWFRNQRQENKKASGYVDETTQNRRYIQFYDAYETINEAGKDYLVIKDSFVYVSNTLKKEETLEYKNKILNSLNKANFIKLSENHFKNDNLEVELKEYDVHPKNIEGNITFPTNYCSLDVIVHTSNYLCKEENDRMWTLSTKMFRQLDIRENPTYIKDINELKKYLPAQVEMGCGPSINVGIPPLYEMHETYKVQNHSTGRFYFGKEDDLITSIIEDSKKMYERFSKVPKVIIQSKPTKGYDTFAKLYKKGIFVGTVFNNNFDRLVKRYGIPEKILRIYDKGTYLPQVQFDKSAKSLICFGTHADRRQIQHQARAANKQIVFIDPEGFYNESGFEPYPIEGPKTGDLIYKKTFEEAMIDFEKEFSKEC
ncbi:MAG: hypothetical protein PHP83_02270 [Clostridia bacterium]|nr:hypothetical protein [Clostridia bacterium]